jgi:hypothetical protein
VSCGGSPSGYRRHKPTEQAAVTLNGKDHYPGRWKAAASKAECNRLIGELLSAGRYLPSSQEFDLPVAALSLHNWRNNIYRQSGMSQ